MSAPNHPTGTLPASEYNGPDLTSPGIIHDVDVIDESPIASDSAPYTAVGSKASSVKDSTSCSVHEIDEKRGKQSAFEGELDEQSLAKYVVPVLEKGVKTALSKPTSPWIRARIWYNPYRMVRSLSNHGDD